MDRFEAVRTSHCADSLLTMKNVEYRLSVLNLFHSLLKNDLGKGGDVTSELIIPEEHFSEAIIVAKEDGVMAGMEETLYFLQTEEESRGKIEIVQNIKDGDKFGDKQKVLHLKGNTRRILVLERTILNFLQRMCGIATLTSAYVKAVPSEVLICPTRKTLWGWLDKKACVVGGGGTHRLGLDDAVLIKDNHIAALGNSGSKISSVLDLLAKRLNQRKLHSDIASLRFIEIEVEHLGNLEQIGMFVKDLRKTISDLPPFFLLFDNMSPAQIGQALKQLNSFRDELFFEASGGITLQNIREYGSTGVDVISIGALTHSAKSVNLSLEI